LHRKVAADGGLCFWPWVRHLFCGDASPPSAANDLSTLISGGGEVTPPPGSFLRWCLQRLDPAYRASG